MEDTRTRNTKRTEAARAAAIRSRRDRKHRRMAAELREAGWTCIPASDIVSQIGMDDRITYTVVEPLRR